MSATSIASVRGFEVLDSRGTPTVACAIVLEGGARAWAAVPSGASTGAHEAVELRDGGERYGGRGVRQAVANVRGACAEAVRGLDAGDQQGVDAALEAADGTEALGRLGANAALAVSVAACLAAARAGDREPYAHAAATAPLLPLPMVNVISGGAHAAGAIDVQDVLVVPVGAQSFAEAIEWAARVRAGTADAARGRGLDPSLVADEGGLAFPLARNRDALDLVVEGMGRAGLEPGVQAAIAIDVAATQLYADGAYHLRREQRTLDAAGLVEELAGWCDGYPVVSLEDPLAEDDWDGWQLAAGALGGRVQLLGDDLLATNGGRLERALGLGCANAVLVKPNQAGTLTRAARVCAAARAAGWAAVVSARSGETEDSWLADLAVGWAAGQIKVGSTMRSERTAKWNRLLRLEVERPDLPYAGRAALAPEPSL